MHGRDIASDRQVYFVKRSRKNTRTQLIYAKTSWPISTMGSSSNAQQTVLSVLRCPETLSVSHENANFLVSVVRMVQGEAKTPKIMGVAGQILHFYLP